MPRPDNVRGRPPGQGSGPDADSAQITAIRITTIGPAAEYAGLYRVADLPASIAAKITIHPVSGCWIVGGTPTRDGHARIRGRSAARVVWEHLIGPIDASLELDHREDWGCLSKACALPRHLLPVSHFVNMTRPGAGGVAAVNIRKERCGRCGAPYDLLNTYWHRNRRDCRRCIARRTREYYARQHADVITLAPDPGLGRAA